MKTNNIVQSMIRAEIEIMVEMMMMTMVDTTPAESSSIGEAKTVKLMKLQVARIKRGDQSLSTTRKISKSLATSS